MNGIQSHLRNKFLAGLLAAVPIVVVVVGALWVENATRPLAELIGLPFPGLGVALALVGVYLLGLLVTSLLGRLVLRGLDHVLRRVPGLKMLYQTWKDVLVVGVGRKDTHSHVVLVPMPDGPGVQVGFTSGESTPGDPNRLCVFLPNAPSPVTGRLMIVERQRCQFLDLPVEEAFKFLISTGNYLPIGMTGPKELR